MAVESKKDNTLQEDVKLKGILSTKENRDYSFIADIALVLKEIGYGWFVPQAFDNVMRREKGKVTYLHVHINKEEYTDYFEVYPADLPVLDKEEYDDLWFYDARFFERYEIWDFVQIGRDTYSVDPRPVELYFVKEESWDEVRRKRIGEPIGKEKFYRLNRKKCEELLDRIPPFTRRLLGFTSPRQP